MLGDEVRLVHITDANDGKEPALADSGSSFHKLWPALAADGHLAKLVAANIAD